MSLVQAYRRNKKYTHTFPDVTLVFEPNTKGDIVCDVAEQSAVDRLLQTPTGFRLYGEQPEAPISTLLANPVSLVTPVQPLNTENTDADTTPSPYVLTDEVGVVVLDLRPLSDVELHAFAKTNSITVHPKAKGDTLRGKIAEFLKSED